MFVHFRGSAAGDKSRANSETQSHLVVLTSKTLEKNYKLTETRSCGVVYRFHLGQRLRGRCGWNAPVSLSGRGRENAAIR